MEKRTAITDALFTKCNELLENGEVNIKTYEIAFQEVIEELYPNKLWWEVTSCEIFMHLLEHKDPQATVIEVLKTLKEA